MEPDELAAFGAECLCHGADLETSHAPWPDRDEVIDDQCSATVVSDVPELPASCLEMTVVTLRGGRVVLQLSLQAGRVALGRPPAVVLQNLELIWEDDPCAELGCAGCPGAVHAGVSLRLRPDKDGDSGGKHQGLPVPPLLGIGPFRGCHPPSRGEKNSPKRRPRPMRGATTGAWTESPHKGHARSCIHHAHLGMDLVKR
jgi:hypothetical protein